MIRLERVSKRFITNGVETVVADEISAEFPTDKCVAILGRNGAGKSTLLEMIAGRQYPDSGYIHRYCSVSWPVGLKASFHPELTGAQNVRFIARVYGVDTDAYVAFVEDFAKLGRHFHLPFRNYSSGMRGRLAFGASVGLHFDIYLMDEVSATGDASFQQNSRAILSERLRNSGAIIVSHSMGLVRSLCDAAAILRHGKLMWFDDVEEAISLHKTFMLEAKQEAPRT
jgi:capsular polysaccharide transport system ATP-binding protein